MRRVGERGKRGRKRGSRDRGRVGGSERGITGGFGGGDGRGAIRRGEGDTRITGRGGRRGGRGSGGGRGPIEGVGEFDADFCACVEHGDTFEGTEISFSHFGADWVAWGLFGCTGTEQFEFVIGL